MTQASQPPTFINLPPPESNSETPSETPGTPTSTTTSLSALSTTAIKDGHRGHLPGGFPGRGHQHNPSISSLEAERADRISRLAGLERVSTLGAMSQTPGEHTEGASSLSPQTTPTSTMGFPPNFPTTHHLTPAYFDSNGQPVAVTKISTVGTASATDSHLGELDDRRTAAGDHDEDILSTDTNYRGGESVASMGVDPDAPDADLEGLGAHSIGGFEDRMSDDGSASLVGFGEGAGSTVSGPIYHPRPLSGPAHQMAFERTSSGLSDVRRDRETSMGAETPVTTSAAQERHEARMVDGVATDTAPSGGLGLDQDNVFVDTTFRGFVPGRLSNRETTQRYGHRRLDSGDARATSSTLGSPGCESEQPGKFHFENDRPND